MNYNPNYSYTEGEFVRLRDDSDHKNYKHGIAIQLSPNAMPPVRAHATDAGADLFAYTENQIVIKPGCQTLVDTGVAMKIPVGYAGFVMPRSSMRAKGITSWGDGLIDSAYRGTIKIVIANRGESDYKISYGDRIGQIVIQKIELVEFIDIWNDTARGAGGFGSTGK